MATTIDNVAQTATDTMQAQGQAMFGDINDRAGDAMAKGTRLFEDMNGFAKDNVEALVESGKIAARGIETLAHDAAGTARKHVEDATAMVRTLASATSPTEFMKLQGDFMRAQFDRLVGEASRSTEAMLKLAGEVAQPISNRVAIAVDKMKIAA